MADTPPTGSGTRSAGMDHPHYDWSPLPARPALRWPGGAPLAVSALVLLEHYEWFPPETAYTLRSASGGLIKLPDPDYLRLTHREYGHRVGVFRVLDTLAAAGVPATVAVDALTIEHYPWLIDDLLRRGCELVAHGVAASRLITSKMTPDEEIDTIARSVDAVQEVTGQRVRGWFSPEGVESSRTPQLLAAAGLDYVMDWPNDEQPYDMNVADGPLTALPVCLETDDEFALWTRRMRLEGWQQLVADTAAQLALDGHTSGRLLILGLRPWLIGQPFRIGSLAGALTAIVEQQPFVGTASALVDAWRDQVVRQ